MTTQWMRWTALAAGFVALLAAAALADAARSDSAGLQRVPMRWHTQSGNAHMSVIGDGARARLTRTSSGISYSIDTHSLRSGHAYTAWVVVVNDPAACASKPCAPADILTNPDTDSQVTYGTGHVVGSSAESGFRAARWAARLPLFRDRAEVPLEQAS